MHKTLTIAKIRGVYVYVCMCGRVCILSVHVHAYICAHSDTACVCVFHSSSSTRNKPTPPATNNLPRPPFPSPRHKNWPPLKQSPPSLHHVLAQRPSRAPTHSSPTFRGYYLNLRRIYGTINECELSGWIPIRLIALTANA